MIKEIKVKMTGEIMRNAHRLTKQIKAEFPEVDYKFQLGLCIKHFIRKEREKQTLIIKPLTSLDLSETSRKNTQFWQVKRIKETVELFVKNDIRIGDTIRLVDEDKYVYQGVIKKLSFRFNRVIDRYILNLVVGTHHISLRKEMVSVKINVIEKAERKVELYKPRDKHPFEKLKSYEILKEEFRNLTELFSTKMEYWKYEQSKLKKEHLDAIVKALSKFIAEYQYVSEDNRYQLNRLIMEENPKLYQEADLEVAHAMFYSGYMMCKFCQ